jgi:hypothetical protein
MWTVGTAAIAMAWMTSGAASAASNIIVNGSFESGGAYSFSGWKTLTATQSPVSPGEDGSYASLVQFSGTSGSGYQIYAAPKPVTSIPAGASYALSAWVRSDTPGASVCVVLKEATSSGAANGSATACVTTSSSWQQAIIASYPSHAAGDSLGVVVQQRGPASSGQSFQVDEVVLLTGQSSTDRTSPTTPQNVIQTGATTSTIDLAWGASSDPDDGTSALQYRVYRGGQLVGTTSNTSLTDRGLSPGTAYSYSVDSIDPAGNASPQSTAISATTAISTGADPVVAAAGDFACSPADPSFNGGNGTSSKCREKAVSDGVLADNSINAVLGLGDVQYDCDSTSDFAGSYTPTWGRLNSIMYPVVGNHEYNTGTDPFGNPCPATNATAQNYFSYFGASAHGATGGHYSFDLGAWHVIALNANCGKSGAGGCTATSSQTAWFSNDLQADASQCTLAMWHQPRWTGAASNNSDYAAWWNLLVQHGVDVVLNGHVHNYQRMPMVNASGAIDTVNGSREFIVGTGGVGVGGGSGSALPHPQVRAQTFGYLRLTLHPSSYDWQFIQQPGGAILDSGSQSCH